MKSNPPILKGTMVTLRPVSPEHDCIPFYNIMLEPEMHVWTGNTVPKNIGEIKQLLQHYAQFEEVIAWAVVRNDTEEMIGTYWIAAPTDVDGKKVISPKHSELQKNAGGKGILKKRVN
ncbi:GNAT family N-acetyltransferase [Geobacillus sp. E263]|uniref:GNAT family N-acetyltransferase n=1 Tax=Geobacillus sp. E263 TaxID=391290 RepID=UPI0025707AD7|nr:GNAT family N-acetyltransferase [Geobacillus sp. E263]